MITCGLRLQAAFNVFGVFFALCQMSGRTGVKSILGRSQLQNGSIFLSSEFCTTFHTELRNLRSGRRC